jgi:hypothetical protein
MSPAADVSFPAEERARFVGEQLFPLVSLDRAGADRHVEVERLTGDLQMVQADVTRRYLDGGLEFARAVTVLEEEALVPHAEALVSLHQRIPQLRHGLHRRESACFLADGSVRRPSSR